MNNQIIINGIIFHIGDTYSNRRFQYTIVGLKQDKLLVILDDGSNCELDARLQSTIIQNMNTEMNTLIGDTITGNTSLSKAFNYTLGFLTKRARLIAEIPQQSVARFESEYYKIKNRKITMNAHGYTVLKGTNVNKWGPELRIFFSASEIEIVSLYFGDYVEVRSGGSINEHRINNNRFVYKLLTIGFDFVQNQDFNLILQNIHPTYKNDFIHGYDV